MKTVNAMQLNDHYPFDGRIPPLDEYYTAGRLPLAELVDKDISSIIDYLMTASHSSNWHMRHARPMRAWDMVAITEGRSVKHLYVLVPRQRVAGGIPVRSVPELTAVALTPCHSWAQLPH